MINGKIRVAEVKASDRLIDTLSEKFLVLSASKKDVAQESVVHARSLWMVRQSVHARFRLFRQMDTISLRLKVSKKTESWM